MIRRVAMLMSGFALEAALLFVRNLLVARLISVEDYGIAATFAITAAIVEMASQLGLQQLIVQDQRGDDPLFQSGIQGFHLLRGLVGAMVLLALAAPIARFLEVPDLTWAYRVLAIVPAIQGLMHFDVYRLQRQARYGPLVISFAGAAAVSTLAILPLYRLFGDWRVMLVAILLHHGLQVGLAHLMASTLYRVKFDLMLMRRGLVFGWPLMVNGVLMFAVFHGEKLIVGRQLGLTELGLLAMGITVTLTPATIATKVINSVLLPRLSRAEDETFLRLSIVAHETAVAMGILATASIAVVGEPVLTRILGGSYAPMMPLLVPLSVLAAVRLVQSGTAVTALARARTRVPMIVALPRVASLPVSWAVLTQGGGVTDVILVATAAEFVGTILALVLISRDPDVPGWAIAQRLTPPLLGLVAVLMLGAPGTPAAGVSGWVALTVLTLWALWVLRGIAALRRQATV